MACNYMTEAIQLRKVPPSAFCILGSTDIRITLVYQSLQGCERKEKSLIGLTTFKSRKEDLLNVSEMLAVRSCPELLGICKLCISLQLENTQACEAKVRRAKERYRLEYENNFRGL